MADTICALATASGRSALAVVRLSGPAAFEIARGLIGWSSDHAIAPRLASLATIRDDEGVAVDQVLATFFPGPASYTGEDVVEFSCHGGLAPHLVVALLLRRGARQALPGEFTRRAVLAGRMDLIQAEAVGDLIDATSTAQARTALHQLEGGLSRRLGELRSALLDLLALLAYDIDFPEEDDGPIARSDIAAAANAVDQRIERLIRTAPLGQRLQHGAMVVFAGRPNAGKSSLFNALLGVDRAIVTDIPGTTRDAVEANADVAGWPVRLVDTAGLRPSDDRIEQMGIEVSRRYLGQADLVVLCAELGVALNDEEQAMAKQPNVLVVRTKADLWASAEDTGLRVSVVDGSGLDQVRQRLLERLFNRDGDDSGEPLLTRERHRIGLQSAAAAMSAAKLHLVPGGDPILAAHEVQRAVVFLEEVLGAVDFDAVLGRVFERFCVGK